MACDFENRNNFSSIDRRLVSTSLRPQINIPQWQTQTGRNAIRYAMCNAELHRKRKREKGIKIVK